MAEKKAPTTGGTPKRAGKDLGTRIIKCGCFDVPPKTMTPPPGGWALVNGNPNPIPGVVGSPAAYFQEERYSKQYGAGARVHNYSSVKHEFRCTICQGTKPA